MNINQMRSNYNFTVGPGIGFIDMSKQLSLYYSFLDLIQNEHRYECIQNAIKQCSLQTDGFLIAGELDEQKFLKQWQEKVNQIMF